MWKILEILKRNQGIRWKTVLNNIKGNKVTEENAPTVNDRELSSFLYAHTQTRMHAPRVTDTN